jgi:monoamine oxidase
VTGIEQRDASVRIELADGATVSATRAILAIPLPLQRRLRFDPPLPEHRRLALERARYGEVVKAALPYDRRLIGRLPELSAAGLLYQPDPGSRFSSSSRRQEQPGGRGRSRVSPLWTGLGSPSPAGATSSSGPAI